MNLIWKTSLLSRVYCLSYQCNYPLPPAKQLRFARQLLSRKPVYTMYILRFQCLSFRSILHKHGLMHDTISQAFSGGWGNSSISAFGQISSMDMVWRRRTVIQLNILPSFHVLPNESVGERASEASSAEQANDWVVRTNEHAVERMAQYSTRRFLSQ